MNRRDFLAGLFASALAGLIPQKSAADKEVEIGNLTINVDCSGVTETKNGMKYAGNDDFGVTWIEDTAALLESDEVGIERQCDGL